MNNIKLPVIDAHTHIFPDAIASKAKDNIGSFYGLPMYADPTLAELYKGRVECGRDREIVGQLVCSPSLSEHQTSGINTFIASVCAKDKSLIGFGTLHKDNADYKEEIARMKELGLRGVKFHSDFQRTAIDDPDMIPVYREIASAGLPVLFHMGDERYDFSSVERLKNLLRILPNLKVMGAHMGGYRKWQDALEHLPTDCELYFDISSTLSFIDKETFTALIERFGVEKFFFGSDFPMWKPSGELEKFWSMGLSEEDNRKIEYHNFMKFIEKI